MAKGVIPLKTVDIGTSLVIPLITYTFIPTGGVIIAISVISTMMMPNQIGSKWSATTTGKKMGIVKSIMDIASIKHPSTM